MDEDTARPGLMAGVCDHCKYPLGIRVRRRPGKTGDGRHWCGDRECQAARARAIYAVRNGD